MKYANQNLDVLKEQMNNLSRQQLAELCVKVRDEKAILKKEVDALDSLQKHAEDLILNGLAADNLESVRVEGVGTFTRTAKTHVEVRSRPLIYNFVINKIVECQQANLPVDEAFAIFSAAPKKSFIVELMESGVDIQNVVGCEMISEPSLSVTKTK